MLSVFLSNLLLQMIFLCLKVVKAELKRTVIGNEPPNAFIGARVCTEGETLILESSTCLRSFSPEWNHSFAVKNVRKDMSIKISVKDAETVIGECTVTWEDIKSLRKSELNKELKYKEKVSGILMLNLTLWAGDSGTEIPIDFSACKDLMEDDQHNNDQRQEEDKQEEAEKPTPAVRHRHRNSGAEIPIDFCACKDLMEDDQHNDDQRQEEDKKEEAEKPTPAVRYRHRNSGAEIPIDFGACKDLMEDDQQNDDQRQEADKRKKTTPAVVYCCAGVLLIILKAVLYACFVTYSFRTGRTDSKS